MVAQAGAFAVACPRPIHRGTGRQMGRGPKPAKSREAKPPLARTSSTDDSGRVRDLETRLAEALGKLQARDSELVEAQEQQTATSEVLRLIGSSTSDLQPVFDIIAKRATALTNAVYSAVYLVEDESIHLRACYSQDIQNTRQFAAAFPMPLTSDTLIARTLRTGGLGHIADMEDVGVPEGGRSLARTLGVRSTLTVPMRRDGRPIGAIGVNRRTPGAFTPAEIALLQTFADQAVIAIESVRLFNETKERNQALTESLDQQTATGEILRVIASSPTDIDPVFAAVVSSAARLCDALDATIFQIDGDRLRVAVHTGPIASHPVGEGPSLARETPSGRAVLDRRTIHIEDTQAEIDEYPEGSEHARRLGFRTVLAVPLMREGVAIGVINLRRTEARLFTERQVALLQTFADQAVIAIENVRLFTELQEKNAALTQTHAQVTESLEQQTATSEILRVISSSPSDVQPVMDTLAQSAARLCEADVVIFRRNRDFIERVANVGSTPSGPLGERLPLTRSHVGGRAMLDGTTLHIPDIQAAQDEFPDAFAVRTGAGLRTVLAVPLMREGTAIGVIMVRRMEIRPLSDKQINLLETFADQAVIAIENVRLFNELQTSNRELRTALDTQTATSDILRVIAGSRTDVQPVFDAIVQSAVRLLGGDAGMLARVVGDELR